MQKTIFLKIALFKKKTEITCVETKSPVYGGSTPDFVRERTRGQDEVTLRLAEYQSDPKSIGKKKKRFGRNQNVILTGIKGSDCGGP